MDFEYLEPTPLNNELIGKIYESFMDINLRLLYYVHSNTDDEKKMWQLFNDIATNILTLRKLKIADLGNVFSILSFVLPTAYKAGYLDRLNTHLAHLVKGTPWDLRDYSETIILIDQQYHLMLGKIQDVLKMFKLHSGKKSILDGLECKNEITGIFKEIRSLEVAGQKSAFAKLYNEKLKSLLQNTSIFEARNIGDEKYPIWETDGTINHRVYKHMNKLYFSWKKQQLTSDDIPALINFLEKNFWNVDIKTPERVLDSPDFKPDRTCLERICKQLEYVEKHIAQNPKL